MLFSLLYRSSNSDFHTVLCKTVQPLLLPCDSVAKPSAFRGLRVISNLLNFSLEWVKFAT